MCSYQVMPSVFQESSNTTVIAKHIAGLCCVCVYKNMTEALKDLKTERFVSIHLS